MYEALLAIISSLYLMTTIQLPPLQPELIDGYATAYCDSGITYSGKLTRPGICAGKKEWIGKTAIVYQKLPGGEIGELIGYYEVLDTGGTRGLRNGTVVDIWQPDMDGVQSFMDRVYEDGCKGHVYIQIVDAEG